MTDIEIPSYTTESGITIENAYGMITFIVLDIVAGKGRATFNIHPRKSALGKTPAGQIQVALGEPISAKESFPTLQQLMAEPGFEEAWNTIATTLYTHLLKHPSLAGAVARPSK